ncbi:MAG TPA: MraY family glycosyltransferase [Candidatus Eisenbacteria bacterium]|nr:MraY family glycosyltransferase [Candidatus Eisenbacteria bacterium]
MTFPKVALVAPLAFLCAIVLTPLIRRVAAATGYIDHPDPRTYHAEPTPLLGGVVIAVALVLAPALAHYFFGADIVWPSMGVLLGAVLSLVLGLVDDRRPMRPLGKLVGQIAAALTLVLWGAHGTSAHGEVTLGGFLAHQPLLAAIALVGVVALLNAVNFLDAMDGIIAAVTPICAAAFLALSLIYGARLDQALGWALVGAGAGFFVYNAPPARIFLGDAGSHLLGFVLAALTLQVLDDSLTLPHAAAVLWILSYPLFDVIFVTLDRLVMRRPITEGSIEHSTHKLGRISGRWGTVAVISAIVTVTSSVGVALWGAKNDAVATAAVLALALGYAIFGGYLRRMRPTPPFDT